MTEKMKTVCVGRFLIDLPATAKTSTGMTFIQGFRIATVVEDEHAFETRISAREKQINAGTNQAGRKNMESMKTIQENGFTGRIFIFGRNSSYTMEYDTRKVWEEVVIEGYVHSNETSFNFISEGYDPAKAANLPRLISQLRLVGENEIPARPGFCFGHGIFLDPIPAEAGERMTVFAALPGHSDLAIVFSTAAGLKRTWPGLIERNAKSAAREPFWARAAFTTLREGKRTVNGLPGEELAVKVTEQNFAQGFSFDWEMPGTPDNVLAPQLTLELDTGRSPQAGGKPVQSSLEQKSLVDLWDKISSSIRLRPTASPPTAGPTREPTPSLGSYASAGELCPQTGWWRCGEGGDGTDVLGGQLQYLKKGQRMPQALLLPPQTLWQKVRGVQPHYESGTPTVWKLVDKRSHSRGASPVPLAQADVPLAAHSGTHLLSAQIGTVARTGESCPASGWWRCEEFQALDRTRWFAHGSLLPAATFRVPPGVFGRNSRAPTVIQRRSSWQLVRHAQAPEAPKVGDRAEGLASPSDAIAAHAPAKSDSPKSSA